MRGTARLGAIAFAIALTLTSLTPPRASAFCGFYVAGTETALHNHATTVVLMREGTRTVLSMRNDYAGPPEDFAMVVPVPVVLRREDVRTLDAAIFDRVERLTGPRLVEYWEEDPCAPADTIGLGSIGTIGHGAGYGSGSGYGAGGGSFVRIEAQFAVGEYDIVVLGTNDSSALDTWLRDHQYRIPEGAGEALRPYVEAGMKFFVARVDVQRVRFENGRALLSPLRVHYDTPELSLPVRLGLLNSSGHQDLVAIVLARNQRFEMANYPNVFIPTNLDVTDDVRRDFGGFYQALLDRTMERNPRAVVTEYAWQTSSCDPCPPDSTLDAQMLTNLGGDVLYRDGVQSGMVGLGGSWGSARVSAAVPEIRLDAPRVTGQLSSDVIRRVTRRHINELRFCYEQSLAQQPTAGGTVDATFTIAGATGAVSAATATARANATLPATVTACMQGAFRRWAFPIPDDQHDVTVTQVVTFSYAAPQPAPAPEEPSVSARVVSAYESDFVATRLHYRYGRDGLGEDLVFRAAPAVIGGREERNAEGVLEEGATESTDNSFQARYAIRHPWQGAIECETPVRGRWGGRPLGADPTAPVGSGTGLAIPAVAPAHVAMVPAAPVALDPLLITPVASLGLVGRRAAMAAEVERTTQIQDPAFIPTDLTPEEAAQPPPGTPSAPAAEPEGGGFCAIGRSARTGSGLWIAVAFVSFGLARLRRRSRRVG